MSGARWSGAAAITAAAALVMCASPAAAAVANGKIAYEIPPDAQPTLALVNPDGSQAAPLSGAPRDSANAAWNADGTMLAFSSTVSGRAQIYTINANGTGERLVVADPVAAIDPSWSPDGTELAFSSTRTGNSDIYTVQLSTGTVTELTSGPTVNQQPRWSPTGNLIAFASDRSGSFQIYTMNPDGSNQQPIAQQQPGSDTDPAWSPDGSTLAYTDTDFVTHTSRIYANAVAGSAPVALTISPGTVDNFPAWSPDGKQILFDRNGELATIPSTGETDTHPATLLTQPSTLLPVFGVDPVWAPAVAPPVVTTATGKVTATQPTASSVPVTQPTPVATGTVVNAATATAVVSFTPLVNGTPTPTVSTARVTHAVFHLVRRSPKLLSLALKAPRCTRRATVADYLPNTGLVRVRHGHFEVITNQVIAASHGTTYTVVDACGGTRVNVFSGVVIVTLRHRIHGVHGRVVRVTAGHHLVAQA